MAKVIKLKVVPNTKGYINPKKQKPTWCFDNHGNKVAVSAPMTADEINAL